MISNINYVKSVMGELRAKKKFGQNFLIDSNTVDKIAKSACDENITTIEIGPGLGALTEMLLKYSKNVVAYEIDPDMYERLLNNIHDDRLTVYLEDFLDTDISVYKEEGNVCSNLPYYVTTPILFKIFESELNIHKITVMVQKEVGDRLVAKVNSEDYGALSIEVQYLFEVKNEMNISRQVFYPQPNVDSAIISFTPIRERNREFEKKLFELVKNCFRMRRKTLHNNLKDLYSKEKLEELYTKMNFKESVRAQELTLDDYMKFCLMLVNKGELNGIRILQEKTVEYMTKARLNPVVQKHFDEKMGHLSGYTYCNLNRIAINPGECKVITEKEEFGWDGWLGPYMSVDIKNKLTIVMMMQKVNSGTWDLTRKVKNIIYSSI